MVQIGGIEGAASFSPAALGVIGANAGTAIYVIGSDTSSSSGIEFGYNPANNYHVSRLLGVNEVGGGGGFAFQTAPSAAAAIATFGFETQHFVPITTTDPAGTAATGV